MRKYLALIAMGALVFAGCTEKPREESSVVVTPPPEVEVPVQTLYHQAIKTVMPEDTIISTGVPAVETLQTADAALSQYSPNPKECAGTVDEKFYTTNDVAIGYVSETSNDSHSAQTVVTAGFETAQQATEYFNERTRAWSDCSSVDLTIDDTNALTLQYTAHTFTDSDDVTASESLLNADQDLVLTSAGELSGEFKVDDTAVPDSGALPDYVISPNDVPEPEAKNIAVTSATVIARFDTEVYWIQVEPDDGLDAAAETLTEIREAVQEQR
ncbi:MAG TPA: hypothetical protein H9884_01095 [Candidatus Yaniella excrementigallinarum]|nr:hypothetical protein [Candidatus Yaniella excrementigallinarum]